MENKLLILNVEVSGMNKYFHSSLSKYWNLSVIDVPFPKIFSYMAALRTFRPNITEWKQRYHRTLGSYYVSPKSFIKRTRFCEYQIAKHDGQFDLILQISGMYAPSLTTPPKPYVLFASYTLKLAEREWPPWAPFGSQKDAKEWFKLEKALYQNAARILTTNEYVRRSIIDDYGASPDHVVTVGYGVSLEKLPDFKKDYDNKTILFVGMDFERKGGFTLLKAFKMVREEIPEARLIIVGPNKKILNIDQPGVEMVGHVSDRKRMEEFYKQASIFVMPSICEPFGLVFLEAMAYKLPCIGTTNDAMPEIIEDGETGFTLPADDPKVLAQKIIFLLKDRGLMKKMGESGQKRILQHFTWDKTTRRIDFELKRYQS